MIQGDPVYNMFFSFHSFHDTKVASLKSHIPIAEQVFARVLDKVNTPMSEIDPGDVGCFIETEKAHLVAATQDAQDARRRINAVKPKPKKVKKENPGSESDLDEASDN